MKSNILITLFISLLALQACKLSEDEKKSLLPVASGPLSEIIVAYNKSDLDSQAKQAIRDVFHSPIVGLPSPEPQFKVIFVDETYFKGYFSQHHNIFVLLTTDNLTSMQKIYGIENIGKVDDVIRNPNALGFGRKDIWARNQNLFYITAKDKEALFEKLASRKQEILDLALKNERETGRKNIFTKRLKTDSFYAKNMRTKGYSIRKPHSYRVGLETEDFAWIRKSSSKFDYGIFLYHTPYTSEDQWTMDELSKIRNGFTQQHVPGELKGSYMAVSPVFLPTMEDLDYKGKYGKTLRGWWKVVNDNMGGPFVSYSVYDEKNQRIITADGFVYGPNKAKAAPLREIEIVLNTLTIDD